MTTIMLAAAKKTTVIVGRPVVNMWWAHTPNPMNATSSSASATSGNASIVRPREGGDDRRRDPEGGQHDDVHLRMAEEPEEVLPQQRVAAVRDVEEVEAGVALELEEDQVHRQRRQREDQRERGREIAKQNSGIRFSDIPGARP